MIFNRTYQAFGLVELGEEVQEWALRVARDRLVREQFQLQASLWISAALFPPALDGALDQFFEDGTSGDQASATGPQCVSAFEHTPSLHCTIISAVHFPDHQGRRFGKISPAVRSKASHL